MSQKVRFGLLPHLLIEFDTIGDVHQSDNHSVDLSVPHDRHRVHSHPDAVPTTEAHRRTNDLVLGSLSGPQGHEAGMLILGNRCSIRPDRVVQRMHGGGVEQFGQRRLEKADCCRIGIHNIAKAVPQDDALRNGLDERPKPPFARGQRVLSSLSFSDVEHDSRPRN